MVFGLLFPNRAFYFPNGELRLNKKTIMYLY